MEINQRQLDEILADFSALGRTTYLDDPVLGLGYAATDLDELGIPEFSPDLPQVPVALIERHQAMWTHPNNPGPRQEVWTEHALSHGMRRLNRGVRKLPNLDGWLIAEWPRDGGGLQLQQPDGNLFVYALCDLAPEWIADAQQYGWVLVLHGPQLGLRVPADRADVDHVRATELGNAHTDGLVTGGLMQWGRVRSS
jgi:hypothetical protein